MTYFLDFDRTIFDTNRLYKLLFARPEYAHVERLPRLEQAAVFADFLTNNKLSFTPGELVPLLCDDVPPFFASHSCVLVTFGHLLWQKTKIENAFNGAPAFPVIYTEFNSKGPALAREVAHYSSPHIFIDDEPTHLDSVSQSVPDMQILEMRRDGKEGCGRYPIIRSLTGLP